MKKLLKIIIILVIVGLIAYVGYSMFGSKTPSTAGTNPITSKNTTPGMNGSAQDAANTELTDGFLRLLLNVNTIKMDGSFFTRTDFESLRDESSKDFPTVDSIGIGRANPFLPVNPYESRTQPVNTFEVITAQPSAITPNSVKFSAVVLYGITASDRTFEWGTVATPPFAQKTPSVATQTTDGTFSTTVTGLTPNTTYYVRAVAKLGSVTAYGTVVTFKTLAK